MSKMKGSGVDVDGARDVGARIRVAREAAQLTLPELARRLGVEVKSLKAWESGKREPRANRLRTLSGVLGASLVWLLEGRDDGNVGPTPLTVHALRQRLERARLLLQESSSVLDEIDASLAGLDPDGEVAGPDPEG